MTIQEVQIEACRIWGVSLDALLSDSRIHELVAARQSAMALCVEVLEYSPAVVDRAFNRKNGAAWYSTHASKCLTAADALKAKQLRIKCGQCADKLLSKELA